MKATLQNVSNTWLYLRWPYLLLSILVFAASWGTAGRDAQLARWTAASGILYVAPLPFIIASIEFRYCLWLFPASLISGLLLVKSRYARRNPENSRNSSPATGV